MTSLGKFFPENIMRADINEIIWPETNEVYGDTPQRMKGSTDRPPKCLISLISSKIRFLCN